MNQFETYIRDRYEDACERRMTAERDVICRIDDAEEASADLAEYAAARAYASWWREVITKIEHEGVDPVDALIRTRQAACRVLTDQPLPRAVCPFALGFASARVEAARRFYRDTAHTDALTAAPAPRRGM